MKKNMLCGLCGLGVSIAVAAPATTNHIYVGASYEADATHFKTIQDAFDAIEATSEDAHIIHLAAGTYEERVVVSNNIHDVMLLGDERHPEKYVQTWSIGGGDTSFWLNGTITNFEARGVTFYNSSWDEYRACKAAAPATDAVAYWEDKTYKPPYGPGQALAMKTSTKGAPCVFRHCRMISGQDTFYINGGPVYCEDCHIEGAVDFIYGEAVGLFVRCDIVSNDGGYFTADGPSKNRDNGQIGYLFWKCRLNAMNAPAYLARPWKVDSRVWFADCFMDGVNPAMWSAWNNQQTGRTDFRDYGTRSDIVFTPPNQKGQWGEGIIKRGTMEDFWSDFRAIYGENARITDIFGQEAGDWRPEIYPAVEIR